MSDSFNGYYVWLGIPLGEQPPNYYRLLGISLFESDQDVIDHAADRQMAHVRTFQAGRHAALSQQILNELAAARVCLLSADKKAEYDATLRAKMASAPVAGVMPVAKAVPLAQPLMPPPAKPAGPMAAPVKPGPGAPAPTLAAPVTAKPGAPVSAKTPAPANTPARKEDADPFGLRAAAGRRPVAAKDNESGSLFDEADISTPATTSVDLSRRADSSDVLIQKLTVYAFAIVASLILLSIGWNTLTRNFGPPSEWFKSPEIVEPTPEPPKHAAPPAPLPVEIQSARAAGEEAENTPEAGPPEPGEDAASVPAP